jgi:hypothetical protein
MKSNPGGQIPVDEILGRDRLIADLWDTLHRLSVVMTAERRIGKTSVLRKMQAEPPAGWFVVSMDLERVHTANEFATAVFDKVRDGLSRWKQTAHSAGKFFSDIGGTEIAGVLKLPEGKDRHWKTLLTRTVDDLVTHQRPNRLVFFWDEMPFMLQSIRHREGEETAMEILDVLRSVRQEAADFRMLVTGSIGLHHVLSRLKAADYTNAPFNDMYDVEVTPLEPPDAEELARRLIAGEGLPSSDRGAAARAIAEQGDCFPYYIHSIVKRLKSSGLAAEPGVVAATVTSQLNSPDDPWELLHYRERIPSYYPGDDSFVLAILDHLATSDRPEPVARLFAALQTQHEAFSDRERLLSLLKLLHRDHYLARTPEGHYTFRFPLIRRWWALDRGL